MLPQDIHMLVSFLNMKLRDDDMSLNHLIDIFDLDENELISRLTNHNYFYDEKTNQIKAK